MRGRRRDLSIASETTREARSRGPSARLFFALAPDAGVRDSLATLARDVVRDTGGRAPRAENMHLTLAFLGNVPRTRIEELKAIGAQAAAAVAPFLLMLDSVGVFREAGVAWAGTETVPADLQRLFDRLNALLRAARLPTERRAFHPHVTLARRCARGLQGGASGPLAWWVDSLALMASETRPEGPRYEEVASWQLGERAPQTA